MVYPYLHFQYQSKTEPVSDIPERVQEDKWHQPWSEPKRFPKRAEMSASGNTIVLGAAAAEIVFEDKWHFSWSEPVRLKIDPKRAMALIASGATNDPSILTQKEAVLESKWHQPWSEPKRFPKRVLPGNNPSFSFQPIPIDPFDWIFSYTNPVRVPRRLTTGSQLAYISNVIPQVAFSLAWHLPWTDPKRFPKGLPAYDQQTLAFVKVEIPGLTGPRRPLYRNGGHGYSYWPGNPPYGRT